MRSELVGRYAFAPKIYSISSMELRMIEFIVQYNVSLLHNILNVVRSIHSKITTIYLCPLKSSRGRPCLH
jgi:hypothetical protein